MLGLGKHKDLVVLIIVSIDAVVVEFSPPGYFVVSICWLIFSGLYLWHLLGSG